MEQFRVLVRPLITLGMVATVCWMALTEMIDAAAFFGLATLVVKYWFDERMEARKSLPENGPPKP